MKTPGPKLAKFDQQEKDTIILGIPTNTPAMRILSEELKKQ